MSWGGDSSRRILQLYWTVGDIYQAALRAGQKSPEARWRRVQRVRPALQQRRPRTGRRRQQYLCRLRTSAEGQQGPSGWGQPHGDKESTQGPRQRQHADNTANDTGHQGVPAAAVGRRKSPTQMYLWRLLFMCPAMESPTKSDTGHHF